MFGRDLRRSGMVTYLKGTSCFDTESMMTSGAIRGADDAATNFSYRFYRISPS